MIVSEHFLSLYIYVVPIYIFFSLKGFYIDNNSPKNSQESGILGQDLKTWGNFNRADGMVNTL